MFVRHITQQQLLASLQTGFTTIRVVFAPAPTDRADLRQPKAPVPPAPAMPGHRTPPPAWASEHSMPSIPAAPTTEDFHEGQPVFTYKAKTDLNLQSGDFVIVDNAKIGLSVAKVVVVDPLPRFPVEYEGQEPIVYKWVVQKIDFTDYHAQQVLEAEFIASMQALEAERERKVAEAEQSSLLEALGQLASNAYNDNADGLEKFSGLLSRLSGKAPTPPTATPPAAVE